MKLTKQQLKQIIKEELEAVLREEEIDEDFSAGMEGGVGYGGSKDSIRKAYADHEIEAMSDEEKMKIYQETGVWPYTQKEKDKKARDAEINTAIRQQDDEIMKGSKEWADKNPLSNVASAKFRKWEE